MKLRILGGAIAWLLFITGLHVQLNVGWGRLWREVLVSLGQERGEMIVGFLPVT